MIQSQSPIVCFEKIRHYILDNEIEELYDSVCVVQKEINNHFEPAIIDTIDLCIEELNHNTGQRNINALIDTLQEIRRNIIGDKYSYLEKLFK